MSHWHSSVSLKMFSEWKRGGKLGELGFHCTPAYHNFCAAVCTLVKWKQNTSAETVISGREKVHSCFPRCEGVSLPQVFLLFSPHTTPPRRSPSSWLQRTRRFLQRRRYSWVWTRKEWGRSRETGQRVSSDRLNTLRDKEREREREREKERERKREWERKADTDNLCCNMLLNYSCLLPYYIQLTPAVKHAVSITMS